MSSTPLRVVTDDSEVPAARQSVTEAAADSRRALLVALRDRIAVDIDNGVPARDLASLSRRLLEIARDIEAIDASEDGDDIGAAAATPDEPFDAD